MLIKYTLSDTSWTIGKCKNLVNTVGINDEKCVIHFVTNCWDNHVRKSRSNESIWLYLKFGFFP